MAANIAKLAPNVNYFNDLNREKLISVVNNSWSLVFISLQSSFTQYFSRDFFY
jgi:hypothetical protein